MVKVETEILEDRQAKLVAEVDPEMVAKEMKAAARRIAKHVNIPGFRKGKAPYRIIAQHYGEDVIFEEALEELGQAVYVEALKQSEVEPYAPGSLDDINRDPLVLTFTVPLVPEVDLGEYREVRLHFEDEEVTDEDVEEALENMRQQAATLDPVERATESGDVALMDIVGTLVRDDEEEEGAEEEEDAVLPSIWLNRADVRVKLGEDSTYPVPGFPKEVLGMAESDSRSFDMSFAEDDEDVSEVLRGKTLHFEVTCKEVFVHNLPELDDEFAKDVSEEFETLEALTDNIRSQLEEAATRAARDGYLNQIFEHLLDSVAKVAYPPIMVEEQIDRMVEDFEGNLRQQGLNLEEYTKLQNITVDEIRADMRDSAIKQVEQGLVLGEISDVEQIKALPKDLDAELDRMIAPYGENAELMRQLFANPQAQQSLYARVMTEKTLDRIVLIARGEAPEIGEEEEEEAVAQEAEEAPEAEAEVEAAAEAEVAEEENEPEAVEEEVEEDAEDGSDDTEPETDEELTE